MRRARAEHRGAARRDLCRRVPRPAPGAGGGRALLQRHGSRRAAPADVGVQVGDLRGRRGTGGPGGADGHRARRGDRARARRHLVRGRDRARPAGHAGRHPLRRELPQPRGRRAHLRAGVPVAAGRREPAAAGRAGLLRDAAERRAARRAVPLPLDPDRRARVGDRAGGRGAAAPADRAGTVAADGCRVRRRDHPGRGRQPDGGRRHLRDPSRRGPVRPAVPAARPRGGPGGRAGRVDRRHDPRRAGRRAGLRRRLPGPGPLPELLVGPGPGRAVLLRLGHQRAERFRPRAFADGGGQALDDPDRAERRAGPDRRGRDGAGDRPAGRSAVTGPGGAAVSDVLAARRPLGRSAVTVPRIALGCGNFGGIGSAPEFFGHGLREDQALELMDAAWQAGIRHFDTADAYGGGRSELAVGRWIASRGVRPLLTTKTYNPMDAGADSGLAPERIARQLRGSLDRLGVGRVDLYLAHDHDPHVPVAESFGAFDLALAEGRIGAYGVSNFSAAQLSAALAAGEPQAIQNSYSLLARGDERQLLPLCGQRRVAYLAYSPLAGGWLTGKYRRGERFPAGSRMTQRPGPYQQLVSGPVVDALDRLRAIAAARGTSLAGLALAWLLAGERVTQVVVGPGRPEHLVPVREAIEHPLTGEERTAVKQAAGHAAQGVAG